nr:reverse transcriptase domain-containing protein [Tanacetum cinerariifolium]
MSAMANTTPLVTTVTKPVTNPRNADATPRVNIQEFCEEYYEDILPIIMDKFRHDRRKDVHTRMIESTRPFEIRDRHVLDRLGHRRQSAFDRLSKNYTPSTTKSRPRGIDSRDHPRGRSRPHRLDTSNEDCLKDKERFRSVGESYDDSFSHSHRDGNRSRHMNRRRDNESPLSSVSISYSSDGRYRKSRSKRHKSTNEDDLTRPWMCEEEDPFTPRIRNFESSQRTRMPNNVKTYDGTGDPEDHVKIFQAATHVERWAMPTWCHTFNSTLIGAARVWFDELPLESIYSYKDLKAAFLAYFMQQKKYVKDPVEIHNIKQKDGETIEDFMKRFKVKTGRNNPELTKCLNEHVPKKMEEMMIATTAFIRGEAAAASKKKGHTSWKTQGQSKRKTSDKRSDFQGHSREGRGSNRFTRLTRTPKEILAAEAGKKETSAKDKPMKIYMIQSWQRMTRQKVTQSFERVKEITFPPLTASSRTKGPLVIEAEMGGHMNHRMFVDGGSLMEILYEHCFNRLRPKIKSQMVPTTTSLIGFSGETIWPLGQLRLLVIIRDANHSTRAWMNFMIVRSLSPYNGIIRRPVIREIQAVPSTAHKMLKFTIEGGIVTICSTILIPTECTSLITSSAVSKEERTRPDNFKVALHPDFPDQEVAIEGMLSEKGRTEMCSILKKNLDIFTWKPSDMTGVLRSVVEHWLNIREGYSPVRQKKMGQAPERAKSKQAEVQKLVEAGIMREIQLAELDEEKTTFHTGQGVYCYTKMPFGLKNAGATYQGLMDKAFNGQIGQNIEVYVDDLVVKSYTEAEMLRDIDETFRTLRKINMKLNPKKCTFGVAEGVFLGYVVTPDGIKPSPDKTAAVLQLPSPRTIKEVQSLNGKLASDFHWTAEVEQDFKQLKQRLSELPQLVAPMPKEELIIYLSATYGAIREHNITYTPRTSVKGQILADFLIEMLDENLQAAPVAETQQEPWTLFTDGSLCVDGCGVGLILINPEGIEFTYALRFQFAASNNEAEYEALIAGTYVAKEENMVKYLDKVKSLAVVPHAMVKMCWTALGGPLTPITASWPFYKWGIEIAGPFPEGPGKFEFLIVAMDYFTKWIEVKAVRQSLAVRDWNATYRTAAVDVVSNDEELRLNLDLLEERRERAAICEAKGKLKMTKYYNARVRGVTFRPAGGKLGPK